MNFLYANFKEPFSTARFATGGLAMGALMMGGALGAIGLQEAIAPQPAQAQSSVQSQAQLQAQLQAQSQIQPVSKNPDIKVGIVQRFGEKKDDKIVLAPLAGDQLTVSFKTNGEAKTITTNRLQLEIEMQPLAQPELQEWVVLSTHRSFESAEASAAQWKAAGINAEIAQPDAWQVWASRADYSAPIVRRLLLQNLKAAGYSEAFIDSRVVKEVPKVTFTVNGFKYARDTFSITSANRRIQMNHGADAIAKTSYRDLFAGDMKVQPNAYDSYTLVNQVPVDAYLRGVVPHEIGASAPRNAIEAQAILARTYALRNLRRFAIDNYEICADTQCQVYFGLAETDPVSDSAIAATSGQVLTYQNELVDALYSSTTGGVTARFTDVWNGEERPYLRPVIDSVQTKWDLAARPLSDETNFRAFIALSGGFNEDGWPAFRWNRKASLKDIGITMKEYLTNRQHPLAGFNQITGLSVTERAPSGRVQKLQVDTDIGSFDLIKDEAVKALVPPSSLLFYVEPIMAASQAKTQADQSVNGTKPAVVEGAAAEANAAQTNSPKLNRLLNPPSDSLKQTPTPEPVLTGYRFVGGGFGHGVGMSQAGAYHLGEQGYSSKQILEFYYPGTELKPISESTIFYQAK
ncbi:MAG: SpoIID/LytB domain-containing protein [Phormidesmis sp.]